MKYLLFFSIYDDFPFNFFFSTWQKDQWIHETVYLLLELNNIIGILCCYFGAAGRNGERMSVKNTLET